MSVFDLLDAELDGVGRVLDDVTDRQWHAPTRCTGWDVGALVAHMGIGIGRVVEFAAITPTPTAEHAPSALSTTTVESRRERRKRIAVGWSPASIAG
ncbi:hypothetical protein HII28_13310 [Planctomonas sp. JC2975]|nr:hypothetical protein [Planctomonas sp. JC2975]